MTDGSEPLDEVIGVVLAGGKSRRMGREKAALELGGQPLVRRVARRIGLVLPRVAVIGPPSLHALAPELTVIPDQAPNLGPLGGLATAFSALEAQWVFLFACDMPFVVPALVRVMAEIARVHPKADVVVPRSARGLEPLHAVYARSCADVIAARVASGDYSLSRLLAEVDVRELPPEEVSALDPLGRSMYNANTPGEWERAVALAEDDAWAGE